ncbi:MAG: FecR domain-containing protein [Campylobacterales bacterium]|nr:FecR domain-containing protein [Campylobacterales bacterium]
MKILVLFLFLTSFVLGKSVGVISALKGNVQIERGGNILQARLGSKVEESDGVITLRNGKAQLLFQDNTVITVGKNSKFVIDQYIFNGDESNAKFAVLKGAFKAMTGKIGKSHPEKFKISTPTSTIGIRGTHFLGNITSEKDSVACTQGAIEVASNSGGVPVEVFAGEITFVSPGELPTTPREFSQKEIKTLSKKSSSSDNERTNENVETNIDTKPKSEGENVKAISPKQMTQRVESIVENQLDTTKSISPVLSSATWHGFIVGKKQITGQSGYTYGENSLVINKGGGSSFFDYFLNQHGISESQVKNADPEVYKLLQTVAVNNIKGSVEFNGENFSFGTKNITGEGNEIHLNHTGYYFGQDNFYTTVNVEDNDFGYLHTEKEGEPLNGVYYDNKDYAAWGHWYHASGGEYTDSNNDGVNDNYINATSSTSGYWIAGDESPSSVITGLIEQNKRITYSGTVLGDTYGNSDFSLTFDFGDNSTPISGNMAGFSISGGGSISGNSFTTTNVGTTGSTIQGKFYGPDAQTAGGMYKIKNGSSTYQGVFKSNSKTQAQPEH